MRIRWLLALILTPILIPLALLLAWLAYTLNPNVEWEEEWYL